MAVLELDTYELDLLCDACDSYMEDISDQKVSYPVGTMERAEMVREKLKAASLEGVKNAKAVKSEGEGS